MDIPYNRLEDVQGVKAVAGQLPSIIFPDREDGGGHHNASLCEDLSLKKRLIGYGIIGVVALLFYIFSWVAGFRHDAAAFAVIHAFYLLFALGATLFLAGPAEQVRCMTTGRATMLLILAVLVTVTFVATFLNGPAFGFIMSLFAFYPLLCYSLALFPFPAPAFLRADAL